ncbi:MAG: hypothetical protein Kow0070_05190 [Anaerolineales bacterium]
MTGVLRRDENRLFEDAHGARRHVFEVANGGGDEVERAHAAIVSPIECYNDEEHLPAPFRYQRYRSAPNKRRFAYAQTTC